MPLPPLAGDIITEARALAGDEPFVFPSRTVEGSIAGHALTVAMRRLGLALPKDAPGADTWRADPPTPHDLRRSVATRLSALGTPSEDIAAVLGHVRGDVTSKHYDTHQRANEKRQALTRWSATLAAIMKPPAGANVVALKRRR